MKIDKKITIFKSEIIMREIIILSLVCFFLSCQQNDKEFNTVKEIKKEANIEKEKKISPKENQLVPNIVEKKPIQVFSGIDYRPFLGLRKDSEEFAELLMKYNINPNEKSLFFDKNDDGSIVAIGFNKKHCSADKMPFNSNFILTEKMVTEKYGKPTLQFKLMNSGHYSMAYYYQDSKLYFRYMGYHPTIPGTDNSDTTIVNSVRLADIGLVDTEQIKKILATNNYLVINNN